MLQRRDLLERGTLVQGVWLRFGSHFWFLDLETEGGEGALLHWMTRFLGLTAELISVMIQTHIRPGKLFDQKIFKFYVSSRPVCIVVRFSEG